MLSREISNINKDTATLLTYKNSDTAAIEFKMIAQLVNQVNTKTLNMQPLLNKLKSTWSEQRWSLWKN